MQCLLHIVCCGMFGRSSACNLSTILPVLILHCMDGLASDCINDLVYMCDVPRITATVGVVAVVAPGRPPSCVLESAICTTVITARQGERITVTVNTGISISPCNDDNYVKFTDALQTSASHCQVSPPTTPTEPGSLFTSTSNSLNVTYRSSSSENFMSIYIRAIGCAHDDLIEGNNIQVLDEAFNRDRYSVNVTCEPGYLLSNTSTSALASCTWITSTQTGYEWSINRKFVCQAAVCSSPPTVSNGQFTSTADNYIYLSTVTYSCNTGYQLNGTSARQCIIVNGIESTWSGTTPSCTAVDCGTPSIQSASFSSPVNTSYGAELLYTCNSSNDPSGPKTARCSENKLWSFMPCGVTPKPGVDDSQPTQISNVIIGASVGVCGAALLIVAAIVAAFVITKRKKANRIPKVERTASSDPFASCITNGNSTSSAYSEFKMHSQPEKDKPPPKPKRMLQDQTTPSEFVRVSLEQNKLYADIRKPDTAQRKVEKPIAALQQVEMIENDLYST